MTTELERLNTAWSQAWLEKDSAVVERLMAEEYFYIAPNGQLIGRDRILEILRSPGYHLHEGTRTEITVLPLGGGAAVLVHRWRGSGTFDGHSFVDDHRCAVVWVRRDGAWQIVMEQCSPITP